MVPATLPCGTCARLRRRCPISCPVSSSTIRSRRLRDLVDGRAIVVGPDRRRPRHAPTRSSPAAVRPWNAAAFAVGPQRQGHLPRRRRLRQRRRRRRRRGRRRRLQRADRADGVDRRAHDGADVRRHQAPAASHAARARRAAGRADRPRRSSSTAATLGLVGLGRIASRVAVAAQALGMNVIARDPAVLEESPVPGVDLVPFDATARHAPTSCRCTRRRSPSTVRHDQRRHAGADEARRVPRQLRPRRARRPRRAAGSARPRPPRRRRARRHRSRAAAGRASAARPAERRRDAAHRLGHASPGGGGCTSTPSTTPSPCSRGEPATHRSVELSRLADSPA